MRIFSKLTYAAVVFMLGFSLAGCDKPPKEPEVKVSLTPEVQSTLDLASKANTSSAEHVLLYSGIKYCKTKEDIFALARKTNTSEAEHKILRAGQPLYKTIDDVIEAAKKANTSSVRHEILRYGKPLIASHKDAIALSKYAKISSVEHEFLRLGVPFCQTHEDILELSKRANTSSVEHELLNAGRELIERKALGTTTNTDPYAEQDAQNNSNELMRAQAAMLEAQLAYVNAVSAGEPQDKILELNKIYMEKKKAYEALGGS